MRNQEEDYIQVYTCWGLENHREQQQGILSSKRSKLSRYYLVWGICLVYGSTTVGQVTKIKVLPVAARSTVYIF